jgi:hypothetical protein
MLGAGARGASSSGRPQRIQDRLHLHQRFLAGLLDSAQRRPGLLWFAVHQLQGHPRLHVDQRKAMPQHVMQLPGYAEPLLTRLPPGRFPLGSLLFDRPLPARLGESPAIAHQLAHRHQEQQPGRDPCCDPG